MKSGGKRLNGLDGENARLKCPLAAVLASHEPAFAIGFVKRVVSLVIRNRLHEQVRQGLRLGYLQMTGLLCRAGFRVRPKRVHRINETEGLRLLRNQRKSRREASLRMFVTAREQGV